MHCVYMFVQALLSPNAFNLGVPQYKLKGVDIQFKNMNIYVSGELQPYPATPTFTLHVTLTVG